MAATKTNPVHLVLQAAAGVILAGVGYHSLFKSETDPGIRSEAADSSAGAPIVQDQKDTVRALDKEAQNSSNTYWDIKRSS
ncbi:hypothetical protein ABBQ38_004277 [Trebouxia sp. C0009 RCD-2024]